MPASYAHKIREFFRFKWLRVATITSELKMVHHNRWFRTFSVRTLSALNYIFIFTKLNLRLVATSLSLSMERCMALERLFLFEGECLSAAKIRQNHLLVLNRFKKIQ